MKHSKKSCLLLLLAAFWAQGTYSQQSVVPPSPAASSVGQSINSPVSLHTGTVGINIPLWTVESTLLSIPISVSYNASGIKPGQAKGLPGMGWSLNAGGVISRTIRGLPDEDPNGWNNKAGDIPFSDFDNKKSIMEKLAEGEIDDMPDLYFFSFPGYSGKFVFDATGTIRTIPYTPLEIVKVDSNKFTITTPNGTEFTFGGSTNAVLNNSLTIKKYNCPEEDICYYETDKEYNCTYNSEWYLTRVETADSENSITLSYTKKVDLRIEHYYDNGKISQYIEYKREEEEDDGPPTDHHVENVSGGQMPQQLQDYNIPFAEGTEVIKKYPDIALSSITGKTEIVQFTYINPTSICKFLDQVIIKNISSTTEKSYTFVRDDDQLLYITDSQSSYPPIHFKYNGPIPTDTEKTDHWGYFNNSSGKVANSYSLNGILTHIFFPTGGYKKFEYEIHSEGDQKVGGARIKTLEIEEFDGNVSNKIIKSYSYENMRFTPAPIEEYKIKYDNPQFDFIVIATYKRSYITYPLGSNEGSHVSYGKVTVMEGLIGANGKTEYYYKNTPDVYSHTYDYPCCDDGTYPFSPPISKEWERGLLDSTKIYRKNNTGAYSLVTKTINNYTTDITNKNTVKSLKIGYKTIPVIHADDLRRKTIKIESSTMLHNSTQKFTYDMNGANPVVTRTSYEYNLVNNLPSKIIKYIEQENKEIHTLILYPCDYSGGLPVTLSNKHIINKPVETVTYEWDRYVSPGSSSPANGDTRVLDGKIIKYDRYGRIKEIWMFDPHSDAPLAMSMFRFSNQLSEGLPSGTPQTFSPDSRYYRKEVSIDVYDNGMPVQTTKDDMTSCTLYSYNYTYPVAEITNATYAEAKTALGADTSLFTNTNPDDNYLNDKINDLRGSLPNVFITSQTFEPVFGKQTSVTDVNGFTTYKQYDNMNRLTTVKDHEGNILQHTEYENNIFCIKVQSTDVNSIILEVNELAGVTEYVFEYKKEYFPGDYQTKTINKGAPYVIDGLESNENYFVKATAKNGSRTLAYSSPVFTKTTTASLTVNDNKIDFSNESCSFTIQVTANCDWTVTNNNTWINVSKTSGSGNGSFTINSPANCNSQRIGTVKVSSNGICRNISVTQECGMCPYQCCPGKVWDELGGKCIYE